MGALATTQTRPQQPNQPVPETRALTILQFRFVACLFGVMMTIPGVFFTVQNSYLLMDGPTGPWSTVWLGPILAVVGVCLIVCGSVCCCVAVKRGEPPIPTKYRMQRRRQIMQQQQIQMSGTQPIQMYPTGSPPYPGAYPPPPPGYTNQGFQPGYPPPVPTNYGAQYGGAYPPEPYGGGSLHDAPPAYSTLPPTTAPPAYPGTQSGFTYS